MPSKNICIFALILLVTFEGICFAQESIIDTIKKKEESFVRIKAIQLGAIKSPNISAALDKKTGKIIVSRKVKTAYFERTGAGLIIHKSGLIVTNLHIIRGANRIIVEFFNGTNISAKILHILPENDLALLKIVPPFALKPITFADSNKVALGDLVINVGSSKLLDNTISEGVITAIGKTKLGTVEFINVNINVYKGDSGGPLLNKNGNLIGIITGKVRSKDRHGIAMPSNKIKKLYLDFLK